MESDFTIFAVDDDASTRVLFKSIFADRHPLELFDSAEACLQRLEEKQPKLFLLDVGLPDLDGYALCRQIKARPATTGIPVMFISGHDDPDSILAGYDAGGEDYIVKPLHISSVRHKVENLRRIEQERAQLSAQASTSDELTTLLLANLDECAVLIKFLRTLNECKDSREVMNAMLQTLEVFRLDGAVQIRMRDGDQTLSRKGENWPLEIAVIEHVRKLERIIQFKRRAAFNFPSITVLVNNMPVDDPDFCGRIRDHLAIAAESADAKLQALQSFADNSHVRAEIHKLLGAVRAATTAYQKRHDDARYTGTVFASHFLDDILKSFAHLGLNDQQEDELFELIKAGAEKLTSIYDIGGESQAALQTLSTQMEQLLLSTQAPPDRI